MSISVSICVLVPSVAAALVVSVSSLELGLPVVRPVPDLATEPCCLGVCEGLGWVML